MTGGFDPFDYAQGPEMRGTQPPFKMEQGWPWEWAALRVFKSLESFYVLSYCFFV